MYCTACNTNTSVVCEIKITYLLTYLQMSWLTSTYFRLLETLLDDVISVCRTGMYGKVLTCWWWSLAWRISMLHARSNTRFAYLNFTGVVINGGQSWPVKSIFNCNDKMLLAFVMGLPRDEVSVSRRYFGMSRSRENLLRSRSRSCLEPKTEGLGLVLVSFYKFIFNDKSSLNFVPLTHYMPFTVHALSVFTPSTR